MLSFYLFSFYLPPPRQTYVNLAPITIFFYLVEILRDTICEIIPNSTDRQNFSQLLRDLNVMETVTQGSRDGADTEKLRDLGIKIMSDLKTQFLNHNGKPWISINPSLHSMCAHACQLYQFCSGPIAQYSEQAQEHWNKQITRYKSGCGARARQHGVSVNLADIFGRMLMKTHPVVAAEKRQIRCGKCFKLGHSARS